MDIDEALEYILGDAAPDGVFRKEALGTYKDLQQRKITRDKKHKQDFDDYRVKAINKALRRKYNKAI